MRYRAFGRTGLRVSEAGFGAWAIGGNMWGPTDDEESVRALRRAFDLGVNFYDTADVYGLGHSERLIARALKDVRDEVIIATKVGNNFYAGGTPGAWGKDFSADYMRFALGKSLERLETSYVDLYQLHNPPMDVIRRGEVFEALEALKREGGIRFYGVSIGVSEEGLLAMEKAGIASIQVVYNILSQEPAEKLFPAASERGVAIVARVPLASGLLTGKFTPGTTFPEGDWRRGWPRDRFLEDLRRAEKLRFLVKGEARTMAQAALKFVLSNQDVSVTIPGAKTVQQVEENVAASDGSYLSKEDLERIRDLYEHNFYL